MYQAKPIMKGDPKMVNAWVMFDWSNSVYQLTISSTIFPIYYNAVTSQPAELSAVTPVHFL